MPSSFGKNAWVHRCVGCLAACSIAASYMLLNRKVCQGPIMSHEDIVSWPNRPSNYDEIKKFANSYYDWLQMYHYVTFSWCVIIIILGFINIVPSHQDFKVIVITVVILIMGSMALFTVYTAFVAFHKPCKSLNNKAEYKLETRSVKDKRPVNIYEDEDETLLQICIIDASVGLLLLCSTFLYFFDSRQHMIEWRN